MLDLIEDSLAGYLAVVIAAATPWVELLIVIPAGIAVGLNPIAVGVLAFAGNAGPVLVIVAAHRRWLQRRRRRAAAPHDPSPETRRRARARRLLDRYGLPGLALAGPALTGIHLATVIALAFGSRRRRVAIWMTSSLAGWAIAVTAGAWLGFDALRS